MLQIVEDQNPLAEFSFEIHYFFLVLHEIEIQYEILHWLVDFQDLEYYSIEVQD